MATDLNSVIQKIATGPHLSKDLSVSEAYESMMAIQAGDVDDVQQRLSKR